MKRVSNILLAIFIWVMVPTSDWNVMKPAERYEALLVASITFSDSNPECKEVAVVVHDLENTGMTILDGTCLDKYYDAIEFQIKQKGPII